MSKVLTLPETKAFLRLESAAIDAKIQTLMDLAEAYVSELFGIPFMTAEFTRSYDGGAQSIKPIHQPLVQLLEVVDNFAEESVDLEKFRVEDGRVWCKPLYGPVRFDRGGRRWRMRYLAGYNNGNPEGEKPLGSVAAPEGLKLGLMHLVRRAYEARGNRYTSVAGMIMNWDELASGEVAQLLAPFNLAEFC